MVDGRALRIRELAHLALLLRALLVGKLLLILKEQLARKLLVQLGLLGLFEGVGGSEYSSGRLSRRQAGGRGWSGKDNNDVLPRALRGFLHGAPGRGRGRSWRGERRPRGPGRHPLSRRPSIYQNTEKSALVATTIN